mmetsp:Transcript_22455/g.36275  ORF Transcript_22455/g.36275 Transcript_22455/m.36275 type:complete len:120 (-) Transcript_22455:805-1164(-)
MSSSLRIINWQADKMEATLNNKLVASLKAAQSKYDYIPESSSVTREPTSAPDPGVWGWANELIIKSFAISGSQVYNDIKDPSDAAPNIELLLWVFPDYAVFSQLEKQLGDKIHPSTFTN